MQSVYKLKKRADRVLVEGLKSIFEEVDTEKLRREVEELRARAPEFDPADHSELLMKRTALRCAAAGAMTGIPAGLFAVATLGADVAYLVYQQFRLILGIAIVYGKEPSSRERFTEAMACLAYGSGVGLGKQGIATFLESASAEGGVIAEKVTGRFLREGMGRFVPLVGAVSGGVLNYVAVVAVGRATIRYYESQIDPVMAEEIWLDGDREHA
ncbi:MAG TPA: EcsC family protein [Thermoanaerobaculia bacterium]|nr:EcsC family protein [Thermoanaerobaculia bacterium]